MKKQYRGQVVWTNADAKPAPVAKPKNKAAARGSIVWTKNDGVKAAPLATSERGKIDWVENDGLKPAPFLQQRFYYGSHYVPNERLLPYIIPGSLWFALCNLCFSLSKTSLETHALEAAAPWMPPSPDPTLAKGSAFIYAGERHVVEFTGDKSITVVRPAFLSRHGVCVAMNINIFVPAEIADDAAANALQLATAHTNRVDLRRRKVML